MDEFRFTATPMLCDDKQWTIHLNDPVGSLREGHRLQMSLTFPKIHKSSSLRKKYQIANLIYRAYNGSSNVTEDHRLRHYERELGYDRLPTYRHVLNVIIADYRSYAHGLCLP